MWNAAFGNVSGLHSGGGGGGYVPAQGWEFVPCSRLERERGRGKSRSPLRTLSSPPTTTQFYEHSHSGIVGTVGTPAEASRGQVGAHEPGTHHSRLKKKFDDLKKRHEQDKEQWMQEKEILLRQVAEIQGGENRRILLDLKTVVDEVQVEVKREESKRSELQLQYTKDRCAWELERAELKCRIAQLEARRGGSGVEVGLRTQSLEPRESSLQRGDREQQRRLLADTHTAAMDLRCRLEHSEKGWVREKNELLERFDLERKEWESQLKDMRRKIEELYKEVRVKMGREGVGSATRPVGEITEEVTLSVSVHSNSTGSSMLSERSTCGPNSSSSSSQSEPSNHKHSLRHRQENSNDLATTQGIRKDHLDNGREPCNYEDYVRSQEVDMDELEAILRGVMRRGFDRDAPSKVGEDNVHHKHLTGAGGELTQNTDLIYRTGMDMKNIRDLNAALKEIARVSEELCSYQDNIRRRSGGDKRIRTESVHFPEVDNVRIQERLEDPGFELTQLARDLQGLGEDCWLLADDPTKGHRSPPRVPPPPTPPPVPPRTTSWYLPSPSPPAHDRDLQQPQSLSVSDRRCHSPCLLDRKCASSPSIVRKFEVMLQENEGKVLTDAAGFASCAVPSNSHCNVGCCHGRWSCAGSHTGSSKSSTYVPVQKSLSEVNIVSAAGRELSHDCRPGEKSGGPKDLTVADVFAGVTLASPSAVADSPGRSQNKTLEEATAEFNRTLFQAERGRGMEEEEEEEEGGGGCEDHDSLMSAGDPTRGKVTHGVTGEKNLPSRHTAEVKQGSPSSVVKLSRAPSLSDTKPGVAGRTFDPTAGPDLASQQPRVQFKNMPTCCPETKHKHGNLNCPSKPALYRSLSSEYMPAPVQPQTQAGKTPTPEVTDIPKQDNEAPGERPHSTKSAPAPQPPTDTRHGGQARHLRATSQDKPGAGGPGLRVPGVMNEQPWKPLTLAALRPADSRSNYGAVERILKSFESAVWSQYQPFGHPGPNPEPGPNPGTSPDPAVNPGSHPGPNHNAAPSPGLSPSPRQEEDVVDLLGVVTDGNAVRPSASAPSGAHPWCYLSQRDSSNRGTRSTLQECKESSSSWCVQKNFPRPNRPANRRLPSRWASRSPSTFSSNSSSTCSTPVSRPSSSSARRHTSFSYSAYHADTVIT